MFALSPVFGPLRFLAFLGLVFLGLACEPLPPPDPENPPCLEKAEPATSDASPQTIPLRPTFRLVFSKEMEPASINEGHILLARDPIDYSFLKDAESPPLTDTRSARLVPLTITAKTINGGKTEVTVVPKDPLQGDSIYDLLLVRELRDKIKDITSDDNRKSGARPLNSCPDSSGIWRGDLDVYKNGISQYLRYRTEIEVLGNAQPRIVEVMAKPPSGLFQFVEVINPDAAEDAKICGFFLDDGSGKLREIIPLAGSTCTPLKPGQRAVIIQPNYNMAVNPYKIPAGTLVLTTKGSTSTLTDGGLSTGETIYLFQNPGTLLEYASPAEIVGGTWPTSFSMEKCDPKGPNTPTNWKQSVDPLGGTPGRAPGGCP